MIHFIKRELETLLYVRMAWPFRIHHVYPYSLHRFSHSTMPIFNIFKKYVIKTVLVLLLTTFICSSLHYHISSGLFIAADVYRYKYSASSPYILNTLRDNEHFLWIGAGLWAVSPLHILFFFEVISFMHTLVLRAFQLSHSSQATITTTGWN